MRTSICQKRTHLWRFKKTRPKRAADAWLSVVVPLNEPVLAGRHNQRATAKAASIPTSCATMNDTTPLGAIPANVSDKERVIGTAGFAKEAKAVNAFNH